MDGHDQQQNGSPSTSYPPAPNPSADAGIVPHIDITVTAPPNDGGLIPDEELDITTLDPLAALKILSRGVQAITDMTGDIPPTPPVTHRRAISLQEIKDEFTPSPRSPSRSRPSTPIPDADVRAAKLPTQPIGSPEADFSEPQSIGVITGVSSGGVSKEPTTTRAQYDAIARKFFSKKPPPISVQEYLMRLHRYCPMSTAVYLAAAHYIHHLSVEEKIVPVTTRTVHRFLLGSLRIAMKALEDLSYPHKRFSGVGGVGERELAKLEISVCYLMEFELRVDLDMLQKKAMAMQQLAQGSASLSAGPMKLQLPLRQRNRSRTVF